MIIFPFLGGAQFRSTVAMTRGSRARKIKVENTLKPTVESQIVATYFYFFLSCSTVHT